MWRARIAAELLAELCDDVDLSPAAFPYMGVRIGHVAGIPVRLLRVGFVGELGYEIHAPASLGEALWDALMAAGAPFGIRPFGVEAQRVMRLEKGHIIVGQDTDGLTHPYEAAMGWAIGKSKPFFVGKRSIEIQQARGVQRTLVGFTLSDPDAMCPKECHLVIQRRRDHGARDLRRALADPWQGDRARLRGAGPEPRSGSASRSASSAARWSRRRSCRCPSTIPTTGVRSCSGARWPRGDRSRWRPRSLWNFVPPVPGPGCPGAIRRPRVARSARFSPAH